MRAFVIGMIACLLTTTVGAADATTYRENKMRFDTWLEVCEFTQYSCQGVKVPKVVFEKMRRGLLGYYDGSDTVFVNSEVSWEQKRATLYHEMTHFLQAEVGGLVVPGRAEPICQAEAEAFAEGDARWERMGQPEKKRGPNWWRPYTHCHKWFDPNYDPVFDWWKGFRL